MSGVAGVDAEIVLAHEANQWTMERRWLRWGTADLGPRAGCWAAGRRRAGSWAAGRRRTCCWAAGRRMA